jgi:drug/metabolite transporter (DMT)-like permease
MALSYAGILLVFGHEINVQSVNNSATVWGALLVFGSAVSYAIYLSYSGEMVKRLGSLRLVGLATTVACLLCIAQFAVLRPLSAMVVAPQVLWLSLLNATLCTALPVLAVMMAIERIGAPLTAQTGMIGPMSTILMGAFILGEPLNLWIIAGTVLVLAGVYMVSRSRPVAMD